MKTYNYMTPVEGSFVMGYKRKDNLIICTAITHLNI